MTATETCDCGTDLPYGDCCGRYHAGEPAPNPEALMRSRFSAFCRELTDYVRQTWHPDFRPNTLTLGNGDQWKRLEILGASRQADAGEVHFRATFIENGQWHALEEVSQFQREDGRWYYTEGQTRVSRLEPGRNDSCPCGSGRKYKKCCLRET